MEDNIIKDIDKAIISKLCNEGSDFLDDYLIEDGYDLGEIKSLSDKKFKQFSFQLKAKANLEKDQNLLKRVSDQFLDAIEKNLDKPIAYLNELLKNNSLSIQYRNLDKLGVDEIKNIIRDQNLLEILELLEEEDESKGSK